MAILRVWDLPNYPEDLRGENSLHVYDALIRPRTYLQLPVEVRGHMNSQWSQRTAGCGAGL